MTAIRTRRLTVTLLVLAALAVLAVPAAAQTPPGVTGVRAVSFQTTDGARIHANLYGTGDHAVVLAHGAAFNKESWDALARMLSAGGLRVLAIDFRGYGASTEGRERGALHLDVLGAMRYLRETGATRVSLLGASMGGGAAGDAASLATPGEVDRLILLAAVPVDDPRTLQGTKLFVVSEGDGLASTVRAQFERAREPKRLVVVPGDAHAQHIFTTSGSGALTALITQALHGTTP